MQRHAGNPIRRAHQALDWPVIAIDLAHVAGIIIVTIAGAYAAGYIVGTLTSVLLQAGDAALLSITALFEQHPLLAVTVPAVLAVGAATLLFAAIGSVNRR